MKDITELGANIEVNKKPWLMLGKGPSFRKLDGVDTSQFFVCTLNHVIREVAAKIAHMIDIDVVVDCAVEIEKNAEFLVIPYRPHQNNEPAEKTIFDFIKEIPVLETLEKQGRLICYNLSSSAPVTESSVVKAKFFSAEAALDFLALSGVRVVRSLGVDGGMSYSQDFEDLTDKTLLNNGHKSFDKQFQGIARTIRETGITYGPLHWQIPVKVFVGTDNAQMAGVKVLEYSIKKYASVSVEVVPIDDHDIPVPVNPDNRARTGFSFSRFHIPRLCGYKGKAIYMDADMQVFTDIVDLWNTPFDGANILYSELDDKDGNRIPQTSVMLIDCEKLDWDVKDIICGFDEGRWDYRDIMYHMCIIPPSKKRAGLPFEWNSIEHYEQGKTKLIHYTDMPTQPWVTKVNKHGDVWYKVAREAIDQGFISLEWIYEEIDAGHLSPLLPKWLGLPNKPEYQTMAKDWVPPFRRFQHLSNSMNWGQKKKSPAQPVAVSAGKKKTELGQLGAVAGPNASSTVRRVLRKVRAGLKSLS